MKQIVLFSFDYKEYIEDVPLENNSWYLLSSTCYYRSKITLQMYGK